uniref:(northern house mosquito) hypothetical protein n=1 Tax=Culex pipiens TaxID=7175 RepID=A0A8D8FA69_CULPI
MFIILILILVERSRSLQTPSGVAREVLVAESVTVICIGYQSECFLRRELHPMVNLSRPPSVNRCSQFRRPVRCQFHPLRVEIRMRTPPRGRCPSFRWSPRWPTRSRRRRPRRTRIC